ELDLLAVRPAFRGRGMARSLIQAAMRAAPREARIRAWVALENAPSHRAFAAAGLRPSPEPCELWAYAIRGLRPRPPDPHWPPVLPVQTPEDAQMWAQGHGVQAARVFALVEQGVMAWLARREAGVLALPVQTLHYRGLWLEELWVRGPWRSAVPALLFHVVEWAKARELDEVGAMVPQGIPWREAFPAQGYGLVATYREYHL
ncbi:MAG: GNAT family N-acetyltransferase, partial [Anaerolineae bacterium]|nr:GNAT family N-acetyltransferase [Anaerolineae bacterium]